MLTREHALAQLRKIEQDIHRLRFACVELGLRKAVDAIEHLLDYDWPVVAYAILPEEPE